MSTESGASWLGNQGGEPVERKFPTRYTTDGNGDEERQSMMERNRNENNAANGERNKVYPNTEADEENQQAALQIHGSGDIKSEALSNGSDYYDIIDMMSEYEMSTELSDLDVDSHSIEDVTPAESGASVSVSDQGNPHASTDIEGNADDNDGDDPILRKNRLIGKLIGFVETLNAQHEFCNFFNRKLVEYFKAHRRYLNPKPIDKNEKLECQKRRFATAIAYLDSLISSDQSAIKILEECFAKFHDNREELFNSVASGKAVAANTLAETLESLIADEPNPIVRHTLRYEIKSLNDIRASMQSIQSELMSNKNKSTTMYTIMLTKIQILLTKIDQYEPHLVASTSNFVVTRLNAFTKIKGNIGNELRNLQNQVEHLKTELEEKEKRERESTYGRIVQINIMPRQREQHEQMLRSQSQSQTRYRYHSRTQSQSVSIPKRNTYNMATPPSRNTTTNHQYGRFDRWYNSMGPPNNGGSHDSFGLH